MNEWQWTCPEKTALVQGNSDKTLHKQSRIHGHSRENAPLQGTGLQFQNKSWLRSLSLIPHWAITSAEYSKLTLTKLIVRPLHPSLIDILLDHKTTIEIIKRLNKTFSLASQSQSHITRWWKGGKTQEEQTHEQKCHVRLCFDTDNEFSLELDIQRVLSPELLCCLCTVFT